jgi:predicted transcriptional regulator
MVKPEPSIFDQMGQPDPDADARRLAAAEADIAAGRTVANAKVIEWLKTWGTPNRKPAPFSWRK